MHKMQLSIDAPEVFGVSSNTDFETGNFKLELTHPAACFQSIRPTVILVVKAVFYHGKLKESVHKNVTLTNTSIPKPEVAYLYIRKYVR